MRTSYDRPAEILSAILSTVAVRLVAGVVHAADTLFTAPLVPEGTSLLDCYIVNVSKKTQDVVIQVFRATEAAGDARLRADSSIAVRDGDQR